MAGRAPASIQRFFRLRVSLSGASRNEQKSWVTPGAYPPGRFSPRLRENLLRKERPDETLDRRYPQKAAPQWPPARLQCHRTSKPEPDFAPVVKLFTPDGGCTWLLTEIDPDDPDIAFGLCDLGFGYPELGSVSLSELESVRGKLNLPIERDLYFTATKTLSAYADEARAHGAITA